MIRKIPLLILTALATLMIVAGGCSKAAATTSTQPPSMPALSGQSLANTSWNLVSYGDPAVPTVVIAGTHPTLVFNSDTTHVSGTGGVNSFGGDCKRTDNQITVSQLIQTAMASTDPAINAQENAYFQLLIKAQSVAFGAGSLTINCAGGQVLNFNAYANPVPVVPPGSTAAGASTVTSSVIVNTVHTPPSTIPGGSSTPGSFTTTVITLTATAVPPVTK